MASSSSLSSWSSGVLLILIIEEINISANTIMKAHAQLFTIGWVRKKALIINPNIDISIKLLESGAVLNIFSPLQINYCLRPLNIFLKLYKMNFIHVISCSIEFLIKIFHKRNHFFRRNIFYLSSTYIAGTITLIDAV